MAYCLIAIRAAYVCPAQWYVGRKRITLIVGLCGIHEASSIVGLDVVHDIELL